MKNIFLVCIAVLLFQNTSYSQSNINLENLFGDLRARHIGPAVMSGRINDMENHPTDSKIIYAGAAGGGVWKSNDAGTTFNPIFDEFCQSIGATRMEEAKVVSIEAHEA